MTTFGRGDGAQRGAALIVVIAIMTILLAIGLTFFAVSRMEVRTATNVSNTVRTELLGDAAVAIAVAALNQDLLDHPTATSMDHGWRSIFSGAWAAGKPWAWKDPNRPPTQRGAVQVNMNDFLGLYVRFSDGIIEPLYQGPRTRTWMYIPRAEVPAGFDVPNTIPVVLYDEQAQLTTIDSSGQYVTVAGAPPVITVRAGKPDERSYAFYNFTFNEALIQTATNFLGPRQVPFMTSNFFGAPAHLLDDNATPAPLAATPLLGQLGDLSVPAYPIEQVARFTDVDNDGNGVNDSMWIPLQEDEFFPGDGVDNDLDGLLDESQENGVDEDGDSLIDQIVNVSSVVSDPDEAIEGAPFVYHGLGPFLEGRRVGDGLDNDGDGVVDDGLPGIPDPANGRTEDKYFLTSPLPGIEVYVDLDGDGQAYDLVPVNPANPITDFQPLRMRLPGRIQVVVKVGNDMTFVTLGPEDVDVLDNDYDLLANDYATYAYVGPNNGLIAPLTFNGFTQDPISGQWRLADPVLGPAGILNTLADGTDGVAATDYTDWFFEQNGQWLQPGNWDERDKDLFNKQRKRGFNDLNRPASLVDVANQTGTEFYPNAWLSLLPNQDEANILRGAVRITHSGEPVCRLVGRAAIQIADVAGKVNVNTAGAMSYRPDWDLTASPSTGPLQLASNAGATVGEYDMRLVPEYGLARTARLWGLRTGAGGAAILPVTGAQTPAEGWLDPANPGDFGYDVSLPGYGRIDDNVDALLIGSNGIDDDGDGLIDEGTRVPRPTDPDYPLLANYLAQLGILEGTDEPGELQRFNPLRNRVAENNFDASDIARDDDNDGFANEIGELGDRMLLSRNEVQNAIETPPPPLSQENVAPRLANDLTVHSTDRSIVFLNAEEGLKTIRKVDYALATPQQIAEALIIHGGDEGVTRRNDADGNNLYFADPEVAAFADGLRQSEVHLRAPILIGNTPYTAAEVPVGQYLNEGFGGFLFRPVDPSFPLTSLVPAADNLPPDAILQNMQIAVNIVDSRDRDHTRTVLKLDEPEDGLIVQADQRLSLEAIETRLADELDISKANLSLRDTWWDALTQNNGGRRYIQYATAGNEAIKINELMVRPVRRVESELLSSHPFADATFVDAITQLCANGLLADNYWSELRTGQGTYLGLNPSPYEGMPLFDVEPSVVAGSLWEPPLPSTFLSPINGWSVTVDADYRTANHLGEDIIQFKFRSSDGLPAGKYYFLARLTKIVNGVLVPANLAPNQLEFSIKNSERTVDATGVSIVNGDILEDYQALLALATTPGDPQLLSQEYLNYFFKSIPSSDFISSDGDVYFFPGQLPLNGNTPTILDKGSTVLAEPYFTEGLIPPYVPFAAGSGTFTVEVPESSISDSNATIRELVVAIRLANLTEADDGIYIIDSFDFSQEPDHEYIELTNISDDPIDVSGWELEVGPPRELVGVTDAQRSFRIPEGTAVAPRGMLLLTLNKFDLFQGVDPDNDLRTPDGLPSYLAGIGMDRPRYATDYNGIGMARGLIEGESYGPPGTLLTDLAYVTVPPINGIPIGDPSILHPLTMGSLANLGDVVYEPTGSVFDRTAVAPDYQPVFGWDFIDYDGDGIVWQPSDDEQTGESGAVSSWVRDDAIDLNEDGLITAGDALLLEDNIASTNVPTQLANNSTKAWDRIVPVFQVGGEPLPEARVDVGTGELIVDPADVARILLAGGILPNYPESDGLDNDGDSRQDAVVVDGVKTQLGILEQDQVDNDADGSIDEYYEGVDEPGAGRYDEMPTEVYFVTNKVIYDLLMDAILPSMSPAWAASRTAARAVLDGQFNLGPLVDELDAQGVERSSGLPFDILTTYTDNSNPLPLAVAESALTGRAYLGSDVEPPDWKAFVERRWYPGDNVIVTLYEGRSQDQRIVDRVSYAQSDVENRTIDDVNAYVGPSGLHSKYESWWPANQMGLDFYRSLERKNPLLQGDRFGTTNRWEANDGNYDDWAESPSPAFFRIAFNPAAVTDQFPVLVDPVDQPTRFSDVAFAVTGSSAYEAQLLSHAMSGSPLRHNLAYRISRNPNTSESGVGMPTDLVDKLTEDNLLRPGTTRLRSYHTLDAFDIPYADKSVPIDVKDWNYQFAKLRNNPNISIGELLRLPKLSVEHYMYNMANANLQALRGTSKAWLMAPQSVNMQYVLMGEPKFADIDLRGVTLGQANTDPQTPNPLNAVADVTTSNPLTLTVGAATVTPGTATLGTLNNLSATAQGTLTSWEIGPSGAVVRGPGVWLPVLSYRFDDEQGIDQRDLYYYDGGSLGGIPLEERYVSLFRAQTLLNDPLFASAGLNQTIEYLQARQPYTSRALMYVAQINGDIIASTNPATGQPEPVAPRMLLEWGPEDGLEGGTYDIYLGTYIPGLVDRLSSLLPGNLNAAAAVLGGATVDPVLDDRLLNPESLIQELPDPLSRRSQDAGFCVGAECPDYMLRTAVATTRLDRTRLLGIGVGNQNFGLLNEVHPRSDGYAYLGTVKIRDDENYLGVFVELPTQGAQVPKRLNMVTHVVLAPRDRTPGKINVNTTEVRARHQDVEFPNGTDQLFTALMGLPGYVPPGVSRDDNSVAAPTYGNAGSQTPWTAPSVFAGAAYPPYIPGDFGTTAGIWSSQLASLTTMGRTEHADGRYYARITDLALDDSGFNRAQNDGVTPDSLTASNVDRLYPLSVSQDAEARFADILQRYPAIANLITTRSDVFEIIATVQSGYGLDQDGDGFINYRTNDEFVTTAESKVRTVYERRVPEAGE